MPDTSEQPPPRRPWSLWWFSLIIIGIGVVNLLLAADHITRAGYYRDLGVSYPPLLRAALALAWGAGLLVFGVGMIRRQRWARRWVLLLLSNYGAFGVLWLMVYARSEYGRERMLFQAVLTAALLALAAGFLRWRVRWPFESPRPGTREHNITLENVFR